MSEQTEQVAVEEVAPAQTQVAAEPTNEQPPREEGVTESAPPAEASKEGAKEVSLRDVVRDVVRQAKEAKPNSDSPAEEAGKSKDTAEGDKPAEQVAKPTEAKGDDAELPPFHKHPRWKEVTGENRKLKAQLQQLAPEAEDHRKVMTFIEKANLSVEEVGRGFQIMALLKSDPARAAELMQPWLDSIDTATGKKLPADLQAKVASADLDAESAGEIARARADAERAREVAARTTEQVVAQQRQTATSAIQQRVASWESGITAKDPDYPAKQSFVLDRVRALVLEKPPQTPEDAEALCQQALKEVTDRLRPVSGRDTRPMRTVTSAVSTGRTAAAPPKTMRDVVRAAARTGAV